MDKKTRPGTEVPSSYAARLFGEEAAGNYGVMGRLMQINRLPVGDLGLLTVGFRITDRPGEKWTRRFNWFKRGEPAAVQGGHPHVLRRLRGLPPRREPACRRRLLDLFRAHYCGIRHSGVETGVRACTIPRLGVAPGGHHQGPASQHHPHSLSGRAGRHRGRGVPGYPHRRRSRPGNRRRRLLHARRDPRRHRPRGPGVQPRMADSAGASLAKDRARRPLERRADQRTHPRLAGCHLALGPGRVALPLKRKRGCIHGPRPRPYTPQTQRAPTYGWIGHDNQWRWAIDTGSGNQQEVRGQRAAPL